MSDLNDNLNELEFNVIRFPDFSVNWDRFSESKDILLRENGRVTDGCFSFTVEVAQYKKMATTCYDPLPSNDSHTEIRQLESDEPVTFEPPRERKLKSKNWSKAQR